MIGWTSSQAKLIGFYFSVSQDYLSRLNHFRCKATYSRKNDLMSGSLQEKLKVFQLFPETQDKNRSLIY